jgi:lambda family phage portal protein
MLTDLIRQTNTAVFTPPSIQASSGGGGNPYDAASTTRRGAHWQPNRQGPTTNLWSSLDLMRARCRDEVRNNPWATAAIDNFESQVIGNGIKPRWNLPDRPDLKLKIETAFNRWAGCKSIDHAGLLNFYGLQALASREIFEAGEVLCRLYTRPKSWGMEVPLQLQLIEGEQMPIWLSAIQGGVVVDTPKDNVVRVGIEFDPYGRRVAYQMYKENPGETSFYNVDALTFVRVPAKDCLHAFKPLRAGQLRGQPFLASGLGMLHELEKYTDATVVRRVISRMFAGFINSVTPNDDLPGGLLPQANGQGPSFNNVGGNNPPGVLDAVVEPGTMVTLLPGETITFPNLPQDNDFEAFLRVMLHRFAVSVGATYEQITGDLKGVNYSSIRAGLLDFRRKCEQFQRNIIIQQFCEGVVRRWLDEAVMAGVLSLPGYAKDSSPYQDIMWATPGWPWVDPKNDQEANAAAVRSGFTSNEEVIAERGGDIATVYAQIAAENEMADDLGLVRDIDPRLVLIGRESNPTEEAPPEDAAGEQEQKGAEKAGS